MMGRVMVVGLGDTSSFTGYISGDGDLLIINSDNNNINLNKYSQ